MLMLCWGAGAALAVWLYGEAGASLLEAGVSGGALALGLGQLTSLISVSGPKRQAKRLAGRLDALRDELSEYKGEAALRHDGLEQKLTHELTERRDALVSEMRQLEVLIDRLSTSFERQLDSGASAGPGSGASAPPPPAPDPALEDVRDALVDGRVDLHLQPIVTLPERKMHFYEGFTRLRRPDGSHILPAEWLDPARRAGLLGVIDAFSLYRCVHLVRQLVARDRKAGIFCNLTAAALEDRNFPEILDLLEKHRDLSGSLVFDIQAADFLTATPRQAESLGRIGQFGYRLCLDQLPTLEVDPARLSASGVTFMKMRGKDLLEQLRDWQGPRPQIAGHPRIMGEDVAAVFKRHGISLIADRMEAETCVVELLDYGIGYGQGNVFSAPRPIKAALLAQTAPSAEFRKRLQLSMMGGGGGAGRSLH